MILQNQCENISTIYYVSPNKLKQTKKQICSKKICYLTNWFIIKISNLFVWFNIYNNIAIEFGILFQDENKDRNLEDIRYLCQQGNWQA